MIDKEIFKLWAPLNKKWVDWVKPVIFINIDRSQNTVAHSNFVIPTINYLDQYRTDTAIILDMPSHESVLEGLACAKLGYRPIPLYNGTMQQSGAMALVDNKSIQSALLWGATQLNSLQLASDAAPVFLLDSNRLLRFKMDPSVFDNSWDLYDQDIPSPEYFLKNGIHKIIVRGEKLQRDLVRILYKFQKKGIRIFFTNGLESPKEIQVRKPPKKDRFH